MVFVIRYMEQNPNVVNIEEPKLACCEALLKQFIILCPQCIHDGNTNVWIVKPGNKSRGAEISLCNTLGEVTAVCFNHQGFPDMRNFVVQKYISK